MSHSPQYNNVCVMSPLSKLHSFTYYFTKQMIQHIHLNDDNVLNFNLPLGINWTNLLILLLENSQITQLTTATCNTAQMCCISILHQGIEVLKVSEQARQMQVYHWYDIFTGRAPSGTAILNMMLHPVIILLIMLGILFCLMCYICCWIKLKYPNFKNCN